MADWVEAVPAVEVAGNEAKITGFWELVDACVVDVGTKVVVAVCT